MPDAMLQPYAARMRKLIEEGAKVAALERRSRAGDYIGQEDNIPLHAWLVRVTNIIQSALGAESPHTRHLKDLMPNGPRLVQHSYEIFSIIGVLQGALDDLEGGYLRGTHFLLAAEVFDSILEQAQHLNQAGYKDPAAVLGRVVIEDALRRLAAEAGLDFSGTASRVNDDLKKAARYSQPQWRLVQSWLDIGNSAAHGKFEEYRAQDVEAMLEGIAKFLAAEFKTA